MPRKLLKKKCFAQCFSSIYLSHWNIVERSEKNSNQPKVILIPNLGRNFEYLCAFKTNDLMIYCTRSSTNYNECSALSLALTRPHYEWIYACHMEQRQKTTAFDVCLLFTLHLYYTYVYFSFYSRNSVYSVQCSLFIYIHIWYH